jgi:hypothetical protein
VASTSNIQDVLDVMKKITLKIQGDDDVDDVIETERIKGMDSLANTDDGSAKEKVNRIERTKIMSAGNCTKELIGFKEPAQTAQTSQRLSFGSFLSYHQKSAL